MRWEKTNHREKIYIYGKHALMEAVRNKPDVVRKVFISQGSSDGEMTALLRKNNIPIEPLKVGREAERMVGEDKSHQGVIAIVNPEKLTIDFDDFFKAIKFEPATMLVLLDELTDPHNVGAIIRSAAAFGASGVLMPPHHQAPVTGAVVKASAGMAFRVPLVTIGNANQTLDRLQREGFKAYALSMTGEKRAAEIKFDAPAIFVVGNEGRGVHQKTMERCDVRLRIPMDPRCESLNASVSAAIVLYEWYARNPAMHVRK